MTLHTPYRLADGMRVTLRATVEIDGAGRVAMAGLAASGRTRLSTLDLLSARAWTHEEVVVRRFARTLAGAAQVQFLECAVGAYGVAGMLAASMTAARAGDDAAAALLARSQRCQAEARARARAMLAAGGLTADAEEMLRAVLACG